MSVSVWVYTCNEGTRGTALTLTGYEYGTCSPTSAGGWQQLTIPDPEPIPTMDIVAMLLIVGMALCVALGYVAGQQR